MPDAGGVGALTTYTKVLNFVPLIYVAGGFVAVAAAQGGWTLRLAVAVAWIYLVPPILARLVMLASGRPYGRGLRQPDRAYKTWWLIFQLQVVHNRLPWLDELLRLVPGLYSLWLRLWGSRASAMVYWGPGVRILDRGLVEVHAGAVLGVESALAGHAGRIDADGAYVVDVAPAVVEEGAILGARSGVGPGGRVRAGAMLPAARGVRPFAQWPPAGKTTGDVRSHEGGEA